jgi:hypothetical protein
MRSFFAYILFIFALALPMAANAQTTRTVEVKMHNETVDRASGLRIKFVGLGDDSRCPTDTNCVWAGNARIFVRVSGKRMAARTLTLNSTTKPNVVTYGGYEFKLVDLTPHPRSNIRINPNGYQATIEVTRRS